MIDSIIISMEEDKLITRRNTGGFENLLPFPSLESFPIIFQFGNNPDMIDLSLEIDKLLEFYCQEIFGLGHLKSFEKCPDFFLPELAALTGVTFPPGASEQRKRQAVRDSVPQMLDNGLWGDGTTPGGGAFINETLDELTGWTSYIIGGTGGGVVNLENVWYELPVYLNSDQQELIDEMEYVSLEVSPGNDNGWIGMMQNYSREVAGQAGMVLIDLGAPDPALITPELIRVIQGTLDLIPAFFQIFIGYIDEMDTFVKLAEIGMGSSIR